MIVVIFRCITDDFIGNEFSAFCFVFVKFLIEMFRSRVGKVVERSSSGVLGWSV